MEVFPVCKYCEGVSMVSRKGKNGLTDHPESPDAGQHYYFNLYNQIPLGCCTVSEEGVIAEANATASQLLGVSRDALIDVPLSRFVYKEDREIFYLFHRELFATSLPQFCDIRFIRNDSSTFWGHLDAVLAQESRDRRVARLVLRDITNRKRAVRYGELQTKVLQILNEPGDLKESIERILSAMKNETGFDAVGIRLQEGEDFPYLAHNGFPPDFLLTENSLIERSGDGSMCFDQFGKVKLECTCGLVLSGETDPASPLFTSGGSFWTNESALLLGLSPAEEPRLNPRNQCIHLGYASVALIPIRNKEKIVGLIQLNDGQKGRFTLEQIELMETIASHIGEALLRKWAEEALQESYLHNHAILASITDAFISLDDDMVVTYFNTAAERILGQKRDDVIGRKLFDIFRVAKGSVFEKNFTKTIESRVPLSFETEFTEEPHRNWYDVRVYPGEKGISIYFQVITERKQAEKEKAALEELNRKLQKRKSLDRMAGAIAHVFNNKLHTVIGHLEEAITTGADKPPPANIDAAKQAAEKAAEVSRMLMISLGQAKGKLRPGNLVEICRKSLPDLVREMPSHISITTDFHAPGPIVNTNSGHIQQILTNLLINSGESIDIEGGRICISVSTVAVNEITNLQIFPVDQALTDRHYACLKVSDNGCGIAASALEEVFSPFYSTKFTGRGLGLSVVLGLVQAHKGVVTAESTPGRGSTFHIYLPLSTEKIVHQETEMEQTSPEDESGTVLVVDDDRTVLEITAAMLSQMGFSVIKAMDGVEAVEKFRQHHDSIRFVLSDVAMPRMNGWETLVTLRQISPDIPVILASGYSEEKVMKGATRERPQAFLEKPFGIETLRKTIYRTLREAAI